MFDYETRDYSITTKKIDSSGYVLKNERLITFQPKKINNDSSYREKDIYLGFVEVKKDKFNWCFNNDLSSANICQLYDDLDWIVLSRTHFKKGMTNMHKLKEGDIIKIGKIIFRVREIKNPLTNNYNLYNNNETDVNDKLRTININKKDSAIKISSNHIKPKNICCRVCLNEGDTDDPENPLINPCNCIGSVRYIHLGCLRHWLLSKTASKISFDSSVTTYSFKQFRCEICKSIIPNILKYNGEVISLIDFSNFSSPCIILETLSHYINPNPMYDKEATTNIFVLCFDLNKDKIRIGRSNESELRLSDISVSRNHAEIRYSKDKGYFLSDARSKFGTLLLIQNDLMFLPYQNISIQIGKYHLICKLVRTIISWLRCYRNKELCEKCYEDLVEKSKLVYENEMKKVKSILGYSYIESNNTIQNASKDLLINKEEMFYSLNHTESLPGSSKRKIIKVEKKKKTQMSNTNIIMNPKILSLNLQDSQESQDKDQHNNSAQELQKKK